VQHHARSVTVRRGTCSQYWRGATADGVIVLHQPALRRVCVNVRLHLPGRGCYSSSGERDRLSEVTDLIAQVDEITGLPMSAVFQKLASLHYRSCPNNVNQNPSSLSDEDKYCQPTSAPIYRCAGHAKPNNTTTRRAKSHHFLLFFDFFLIFDDEASTSGGPVCCPY